jgi:hypothetical protein
MGGVLYNGDIKRSNLEYACVYLDDKIKSI